MKKQQLKKILAGFLAGAMVITSVGYIEPVTAYAANKTVTVSTQKELNSALKVTKKSNKTILIKTSKAKTFTIKKGTYAKVTLKVNAPKSNIVNSAKFAAVQIANAKTITEKGNGNTITDTDKNIKLIVSKNAKKTAVVANKKGGTLNLVANGELKSVQIRSAQKVVISGNNTTVPSVSALMADTDITSSISIKLYVNANATVKLNKGAENSIIKLQGKTIAATIQNNTAKQIVVKHVDGKETIVDAGKTVFINTSSDDSKNDDSKDESKDDDSNNNNNSQPSNIPGGNTSGGNAEPSKPEETENTVTTLDDLKKKLEESRKSQTAVVVTYKSNEKENIEIPEENYTNITLIVNAPNATITNKAKFAKVVLKRIASNTWIEKTMGNLIDIVAPNVHIQIPENCSAKITINKSDDTDVSSSNVQIDNNGQIESLVIDAKAEVQIGGNSINSIIPVETKSEGVTITTTCPVQVKAEKSVTLDLQNTASASSSVTVANASVAANIKGVGQVTVTNKETGHQSMVMAEPSNNIPSDSEAISKTKLIGTVVDTNNQKLSATVYAFKYQSSQTNSSLEEAIAGLKETDRPSDVYVSVTRDDGSYELTVPYGNYSLVIKAENKTSYFRTVVAVGEMVVLGETMLQDLKVGKGSIVGTVTDAATGATVPAGITIRLYAGEDTVWGEPYGETTTDENGKYAFDNVDPGYYTLQFVDLRETDDSLYVIASNGGLVKENVTLTIDQIISKRVNDGQIRFVLHWSAEDKENDTVANDLDSHLIGPGVASGEKFHVYFGDRTYEYTADENDDSEKYVDLDVDDTEYLGPETITIYKSVNGLYHYYVHNYTDGEADSYYTHRTRLATSKPYVEVIRGDVRIAEFSLAADAVGNVWDVCTYDPATNTINAVDKIYFNDNDCSNIGEDAAYYKKQTEREKQDYIRYYGDDVWGTNDVTKSAQDVIDMNEEAIKSADVDVIREVYDALHWEIVEYKHKAEAYNFDINGVSYKDDTGLDCAILYDTGYDWNDDDEKEYYLTVYEDADEELPDIHEWKFDVDVNVEIAIKTIDEENYVVVKNGDYIREYKVSVVKRIANWPLALSINGTCLDEGAWDWHFYDAPENESYKNEVIVYGLEEQLSGTPEFTVAEGATAVYKTAAEDKEEVPEGYIGLLSIYTPDSGTINFLVKYVQKTNSNENVEEGAVEQTEEAIV